MAKRFSENLACTGAAEKGLKCVHDKTMQILQEVLNLERGDIELLHPDVVKAYDVAIIHALAKLGPVSPWPLPACSKMTRIKTKQTIT